MAPLPTRTAACACGRVLLETRGEPILVVECLCDDCQEGGRRLRALGSGPSPVDEKGATASAMFRNDRARVVQGQEQLRFFKVKDGSPTTRAYAACCGTGMYMAYDRGPHWVDIYSGRFRDALPPLEMRTCTKWRPEGVVLPDDVPNHPSHSSPKFMLKLLLAWLPMLLRREQAERLPTA